MKKEKQNQIKHLFGYTLASIMFLGFNVLLAYVGSWDWDKSHTKFVYGTNWGRGFADVGIVYFILAAIGGLVYLFIWLFKDTTKTKEKTSK
jgi:hypothetical protein